LHIIDRVEGGREEQLNEYKVNRALQEQSRNHPNKKGEKVNRRGDRLVCVRHGQFRLPGKEREKEK
jgi:hypothetical protein